MKAGTVYLVGAGPGDPGLITVRGMECIRMADVIIYDYLTSERLLEERKPSAEVIYVGKRADKHALEQDEINQLLVDKARQYDLVVRLKGGDPFVFGRGGEEALTLAQNGISFEVVPGVTAAVAAAAYAGIPVTDRRYSSSFALITGHEDPTKPESSLDWDRLATGVGTLAFYMGVKNLPEIVSKLIEHGRSPETPAAVIRWGTKPEQKTLTGTLADIVSKVKEAELAPPAIAVVGDVVKLREHLNWFETKPLFGRRIAVTRSRAEASELARRLEELGALTMELPTIRIAEAEDYGPLDSAIRAIDEYDWVIFTSVNGVEHFFRRLFALDKDARDLKGVRLCAIGPATAAKIDAYSLRVDLQPPRYLAEAIVEEFKKQDAIRGQKFLLPRSDVAPSALPDELTKLGAVVTNVVAYRTVAEKLSDEKIRDLTEGQIDFVTFTSSSTVRNFVEQLGDRLKEVSGRAQYASIGPVTSKTAKEYGLSITVEAGEHTIDGLIQSLMDHFERD